MTTCRKLKKLFLHTMLKNPDPAELQGLKERLSGDGIQVITGDLPTVKEEGCLVVTDILTEDIKPGEVPVLVWLHEGNRDREFSGCHYYIEGFQDADGMYFERTYLRCKKLPWVIGETKRLFIREMELADLDGIYDLYSEPELLPFLEPLQENREEEAAYLRRYIENMYGIFGYGYWLMVLKETGEIIGRIGVSNTDEEDVLELGFLVKPAFWRQGFAEEAIEGIKTYLQEELPDFKVVAFCHPDNRSAIALCKKTSIECRFKI